MGRFLLSYNRQLHPVWGFSILNHNERNRQLSMTRLSQKCTPLGSTETDLMQMSLFYSRVYFWYWLAQRSVRFHAAKSSPAVFLGLCWLPLNTQDHHWSFLSFISPYRWPVMSSVLSQLRHQNDEALSHAVEEQTLQLCLPSLLSSVKKSLLILSAKTSASDSSSHNYI